MRIGILTNTIMYALRLSASKSNLVGAFIDHCYHHCTTKESNPNPKSKPNPNPDPKSKLNPNPDPDPNPDTNHNSTTKELWSNTPTVQGLTESSAFFKWYTSIFPTIQKDGSRNDSSTGHIGIGLGTDRLPNPFILEQTSPLPCTSCGCPDGMAGPA